MHCYSGWYMYWWCINSNYQLLIINYCQLPTASPAEALAEAGQRNIMETIIQTMPGYRLNEYMLVLTPHEELRKKIIGVKKEFAETYKCPQALWTKPHLMLARFTQYEMMEERVLNRLKVIAMAFHAIKIELKDFGSYPSHSIFINVVSREPIKALISKIS